MLEGADGFELAAALARDDSAIAVCGAADVVANATSHYWHL